MGRSRFKTKGVTKKEFMDEMRVKGRKIPPHIHFKLMQHKKCFYCNKPFKKQSDKTVHHQEPVCKGGNNDLKNLCVVHKGVCSLEMDRRAGVFEEVNWHVAKKAIKARRENEKNSFI